jgi:hypothetical protein
MESSQNTHTDIRPILVEDTDDDDDDVLPHTNSFTTSHKLENYAPHVSTDRP